jgi:small subunit ribosomal protein S5
MVKFDATVSPVQSEDKKDSGLIEYLVSVDRVTKVVKGGRVLAFSALVVVGDGAGSIGFANGKAKEVPVAVQKAVERAKRSLRKVVLVGEGGSITVPHRMLGKHGASKILVMPAKPGAGLVAGGAARIVFSAAGVQDVVAKSFGSTNPKNMVRAVFSALSSMRK